MKKAATPADAKSSSGGSGAGEKPARKPKGHRQKGAGTVVSGKGEVRIFPVVWVTCFRALVFTAPRVYHVLSNSLNATVC